jgi:tRNA G26 N,N-dimethylase Trm1
MGDMMTKTAIEKTCDVCGKIMQKDGPIWYGGTVKVEENYAAMNHYPHTEFVRDVCRECMRGIRTYLKVPQFDCEPLTPEMQDCVDRAVASMAREARGI